MNTTTTVESILSQQHYDLYTPEDEEVWSILFMRQMVTVKTVAYRHFAGQLKKLRLSAETIPDFRKTNPLLEKLTGWNMYAVPGLTTNGFIFRHMADKRFGAATWLRKKEQLDYRDEPDMFHGVFGHMPLLADPIIAAYLFALARIVARYSDNEDVIEAAARLYGYTIESGLVKEGKEIKIYGAGILSSIRETQFVISPVANWQPFSLQRVLVTPYIQGKFQKQYFVLDSLGQLKIILKELDYFLKRRHD